MKITKHVTERLGKEFSGKSNNCGLFGRANKDKTRGIISQVLRILHALELERIEERKVDALKGRRWLELRYQVLQKANGRCMCCGAKAADGAELHVDHIKPKSLYPELTFEFSNLQVLCRDCNVGKSNIDETDWRTAAVNTIVDSIESGLPLGVIRPTKN